MQPKQPKAETQAMSEYGEPWEQVPFVQSGWWIRSTQADSVPLMRGADRYSGQRAVACVNALAGIPNPEAVREVIEAAQAWVMFQANPTTTAELYEVDGRLHAAVESLSAPPRDPGG